MQYKGFKQMKRVAAVILSAAIMLTDVPGASAAEYGQDLETEVLEETTENAAAEDTVSEDAALENEASEETEAGDEAAGQQTETSQTEVNTEINTDAEQAASDFSDASATVETEETGTEDAASETQTEDTTEITTETEETIETIETEITETETISEEIPQPEVVPLPDVDDSVYELESVDNIIDNAAPFVSYNAEGTLEKNEQGEYVIENKDQFIIFLASNTDYSDSTVQLNCDVDMKGETARFARTFEGIFKGNGHSICNYRAEGGLFKEIGANGEVEGLHLSGVTFSQERASAALAVSNNGAVSDITVNADIKVTEAMISTAGIVLENSGTISDCVFAGNITASAGTDNAGKSIGGIVSSNKGTIENCYALGSIDTNAAVLGGIAASNSKKVINCINYMTIAGAYDIGGIAAENTGTISGCANYGTITQKNSSEEGLAGGIAAKNTEKISDCENYAEIKGTYKNIGGIAGSSSESVTDCGNYAEIWGAENVGGIVGLFNGTSDDGTNVIQNSFNKGKVNVITNTKSNHQGIGGILGAASKNAKLTIENAYNTGTINGISDTRYLGGIAGVLYKGSIKNAYNTGAVSAADSTDEFQPYAAMIAGFMGAEGDADCKGCLILDGDRDVLYYRESGEVRATDQKKTSDELKSSASALGGGFASDDNDINDGYPIISGQKAKTDKYIIMYEPNGGCADYYFKEAKSGTSIQEPDSPAKKSASFLGWFKDRECTDKYSFSDSVTKSAVLYAGWESGKLVEDITLAQTEVTLVKGETFNLKEKVQFEPKSAENTALTFSSSDDSVATVDTEGIVRAVGEGTEKTATITVKMADNSLDKELTFTVNVSEQSNVVRFKLYDDKSTAEIKRLSISVNDPITVEAIFGAKTPNGTTVKWSSNRPDYVNVEGRTDLANVNAARLDGLKPTDTLEENSVNVMCTLIYPDQKTIFTGVLEVTVKPLAETVSVWAGKENATDKTVIYDIGIKKFIAVGETKLSEPTDTLSATVRPETASQKVKWSSSDSDVIQFGDDESGKAESHAVGEATVTAAATDGSKDKKPVAGKTTVKVRRIIQELSFTPKAMDGIGSISVDKNGRIEIAAGASIKLEPTYVPSGATEKKIKWTNGKKNALELTKVEEETNVLVVTAKKVAEDTVVKLRADATDMGGAFCEIEFIIKPKVEKIKIFKTDDTNRENNLSGKNLGIDPEKDNMTFSLMAVNEPNNASQMVTWKINNTKVADLKDNEDGTCTVQVKAMGMATITATATDGSKTTAATTLNITSLASAVEIEGSNMVMKGKTIKLTAAVYPKSAQNKNIKWESSDPNVASVNPTTGEVRGVKVGYASIKATANDGSGASSGFSHAIWVTDPVEKFDIMIPEPEDDNNSENDEILTGKTVGIDPDSGKDTYTVAARIFPTTACQEIEWKSSNEKIATVEPASDNTCIITAKALGKATITMSAVDGSGRKASVTVNIGTLVRNIKITGGHYVGIDQELQLKAEVGDKDASSKAVIWKSEYPRAATVDENGLVTGLRDGDTIITAEAADGSGVKAEYRVYVIKEKNNVSISAYEKSCAILAKDKKKYIKNIDGYDIDLSNKKTDTIRLQAELTKGSSIRDGVPMDIKWSTSDKSIATIESKLEESDTGVVTIGVVTIRKAGTVTITATTTEGYEKSESVTMTVTNRDPYVEITGPGHYLASGKKMKLSAGNVAVDWYSENLEIAKVNDKGQVTACKGAEGTVTIRAEAIDGILGKGHSGYYEITVGSPTEEVVVRMNSKVVTGEKIGIDLMTGLRSIQLDALLDTPGDYVTWKSSNKNIAEMDEYGYVDFKKNGNVTFTATAADGSNKKGKVTFVVTKQVTSMNDHAVKEVEVGLKKSVQLNIDYKPLSSTIKKATWESSDSSVVSVNKKSGKITGKSEGTARITATAADNSGEYCFFDITVTPAVGKVELVKTNPGTTLPDSEYQDVIGIDSGEKETTVTLKANLYQKIGKEYESIGSQRVSWSSSNKKIAVVDEDGKVTALKNGEVTITATALDGSKKSGKVKIYIGKLIKDITFSDDIKNGISLNLRTRKTMELAKELKVSPINATNQDFTYTSSDKRIVTVNAKGKVTAKKEGEAEITITPKDGSGIIRTIHVDVTR